MAAGKLFDMPDCVVADEHEQAERIRSFEPELVEVGPRETENFFR